MNERAIATRKRVIDAKAIKRAAERSAIASARLEGRIVPADFVRSERVQDFLDQRWPQH